MVWTSKARLLKQTLQSGELSLSQFFVGLTNVDNTAGVALELIVVPRVLKPYLPGGTNLLTYGTMLPTNLGSTQTGPASTNVGEVGSRIYCSIAAMSRWLLYILALQDNLFPRDIKNPLNSSNLAHHGTITTLTVKRYK